MINDEGIETASLPQVKWERPSFQKIYDQDFIRTQRGDRIIGEGVPDEKVPEILNLAYCLLDESEKVPCPVFIPGCTIEKDMGVITHNVKNASGGGYFCNYRWFVVLDRKKKTRNIYLTVSSTDKTVDDSNHVTSPGYSLIIVAIDEDGKIVPRLQVNLNKHLIIDESGFRLEHDGRRSARKTAPLLEYIEKIAPELLNSDNKIEFGHFDSTKNIVLSDTDTAKAFGRVVSYTLLRSELKITEAKQKKSKAKKKVMSKKKLISVKL